VQRELADPSIEPARAPKRVPATGSRPSLRIFQQLKREAHKSLRDNQKVSFDATTGPKGDQASNIKSLD
jgi:cold shock protein